MKSKPLGLHAHSIGSPICGGWIGILLYFYQRRRRLTAVVLLFTPTVLRLDRYIWKNITGSLALLPVDGAPSRFIFVKAEPASLSSKYYYPPTNTTRQQAAVVLSRAATTTTIRHSLVPKVHQAAPQSYSNLSS